MVILGLDPGTTRVGYGVIVKERGGILFRSCGLLGVTSADPHRRLVEIEAALTRLIRAERPDLIALERLFFVKNQKTGMAVAEARGLLTFTAAKHKIPLLEFTPLEVKRGLTGYGLAKKSAVLRTVRSVLHLTTVPGGDDAADALAIALVAAGSAKRIP